MSVITGTKENFEGEVLNSTKPVLVDFNAEWCGPCRMLGPVIEKIAKERDDIKVVSVNVDDQEELSEEYHVFTIPCLVVIKDGKEVKRSVGFIPQEEVEKLIGE